jgi:DeoR family transcriptional regulator, fructose operon transcriptional repressor
MLSAERKIKIAQIIKNSGGIRTAELSQLFQVSQMTVLRDLAVLEKEGILQRVYGGAVSMQEMQSELPRASRIKMHSAEKDSIADAALALIKKGDCIFLDASTTTLSLAKRLYAVGELTVISNGLDIINEVSRNGSVKLICPGGDLNRLSMSFMGPETDMLLSNLNFDKVFFSSSGISDRAGITDPNLLQAKIKKTVIENAKTSVLLADISKFDKITLNKICPLARIDIIITDSEPDDRYMDFFIKNNIQFLGAHHEVRQGNR